MYILGIESSCDDTSISVVKDGRIILSNIIFSQIEKHTKYYGVVPEIASREHLKIIDFVYKKAVKLSSINPNQIDAIAVTTYPGLIGSLIIGVNFAKGLSISLNKPLIAVNHLIAHIYSAFLVNSKDNIQNNTEKSNLKSLIDFPIIALLVSGGHTAIIKMDDFFNYEIIGKTIDDAAGEAFDKISKYFELGYPGGPIIDKLSNFGNENSYKFPIPLQNIKKYKLNFSFSGIKTAVMYHRDKYLNKKEILNNTNLEFTENLDNFIKNQNIPSNEDFFKNILLKQNYLYKINKLNQYENLFDIAASFQKTVAESLFIKVKSALNQYPQIKNIVIAGGVSANSKIREVFLSLKKYGYKLFFPQLDLCMDNGAMVAGIGYHYFKKKLFADLTLNPYSRITQLKRGSF